MAPNSFTESVAAKRGILIHSALERVAISHDPDQAWIEAVAAFPGDIEASLSRTRRRYLRVAHAVVELVKRPGLRAHPEMKITAGHGTVGGTADLILEEEGTLIVIDYKSGNISDGETTNPHYETQIQLYAALAAEHFGKPVSKGLLWSMKQGFIDVDVSIVSLERAMRQARTARSNFNEVAPARQPANPRPTLCRWCQHVWQCESFWSAVEPEWEADLGMHAIEATMVAIETSNSGHAAIRIERVTGTTTSFQAVAGVPTNWTAGLETGSRVRLSGLYAPKDAEVALRWGNRGQLGVIT